MKNLLIGLLILGSLSVFAYESCEIKLGFQDFFIESQDGGLALADGSKFSLLYRENGKKNVVTDAQITIIKLVIFDQREVSVNTGIGQPTTNKVTDYAVRVNISTSSTEIYPAMLGNPAVKELTVSTMCTSIVTK